MASGSIVGDASSERGQLVRENTKFTQHADKLSALRLVPINPACPTSARINLPMEKKILLAVALSERLRLGAWDFELPWELGSLDIWVFASTQITSDQLGLYRINRAIPGYSGI